MSDGATYLESNKPEAERCVEMAADAWKAGDLSKAQRMLTKSLKLYPTRQAQMLIQQLAAEVDKAQQREQQRNDQQRRAAEQQYQERQQQQQQQQQQHHQRQQQHTPQRGAAPAAAAATASSAKSPPPPPGAGYTHEQSESARLIIARKKDYYSIFSVSRTATESEIKSSYRKLALRFHPDKNKAPEAEEAFKAVNSAFQCLTDVQKRAHYDAYGEEDNTGGAGAAAQRRQPQYHREEDFSADDLFNAFFNGGMNGMGGGNGGRRTYTYRRQAAPRANHNDESPAAMFSQFAHFLPLLLLLLFGLLSAPSSEEQLFGLEKSVNFPVMRVTQQAQVNYFVNQQFDYRFRRDKRAIEQVEAMVEAQAFKQAEEQCQKQKRDLASEERRVKKDMRGKELAAKLQALHARQLDACDRLRTYQTNAHGKVNGG